MMESCQIVRIGHYWFIDKIWRIINWLKVNLYLPSASVLLLDDAFGPLCGLSQDLEYALEQNHDLAFGYLPVPILVQEVHYLLHWLHGGLFAAQVYDSLGQKLDNAHGYFHKLGLLQAPRVVSIVKIEDSLDGSERFGSVVLGPAQTEDGLQLRVAASEHSNRA